METNIHIFGKDINNVSHVLIAATNWQYPEGANVYQCLTMCGKEDVVCVLEIDKDSTRSVCLVCQRVLNKRDGSPMIKF